MHRLFLLPEQAMKQKYFFVGVAALMLATATLPSFADDNHVSLLGGATEPSAASLTITIGPNTAYVNVTRGDIVKFVVGDKSFAWSFDGASTISEIDLNNIAPPGILNHLVKVYVKRNTIYDGA
jgi:hypothetical protein